jgi:hypothetical protein
MQPRSPRVEILLSVARRICRGGADLNPQVRFFDFRPADRVHCHCSLGSFIRHGGRGQSRCRVHDDVQRYEQILAEDFISSLPDCLLRNEKQFLEMMAVPRPFTELKMDDVRIRLLGDFATIHSHMTFRTKDGVLRQGRYTDDCQRRDGKWLCVAANVIAEGL